MASFATASASPDAVITVKINYDGCTRRAKMVLRDMIPQQLEQQVRSFLHVPAEQQLTIERYSDSAGSYVVLDNANVAVYKQLYRAAKAKSKLKLRVTNPNADDKPAPRPVTVEEVPEASSTAESQTDSQATVAIKTEEGASAQTTPPTQQPAPTPRNPVQVTLPLRSGPVSRTYDGDALSKAAQQLAEFEIMRKDLTRRLNNISIDNSIGYRAPEAHASPEGVKHIGIVRRKRAADNSAPKDEITPVASGAAPAAVSVAQQGCTRNTHGFAVCCNSCDKTCHDVHYHCSTCDDGDFDLCPSCVDLGITCHSPAHWMIKRTTVNGQIVSSITEVNPPKPKKEPVVKAKAEVDPVSRSELTACFPPPLAPVCYEASPASTQQSFFGSTFPAMRTCNNCVASFPEMEFLHCTSCEDFDLCRSCFGKDKHGHHPMHAFTPAVAGTKMSEAIKVMMAPGRNEMHHAICDGCDKYIMGVRHKCLDCPDWDYCTSCHPNAPFVHPGHRFVPIYTPLADSPRALARLVHQGICCDGPLCANDKGYPTYIRGTRYKCAVCDDVDFCANCEANPNTKHNMTHPLIKFQTPIRHVNVKTSGSNDDGTRMRPMGDGAERRRTVIPAERYRDVPKVAEKKVAPVPAQVKVEAPAQVVTPVKVLASPQPALSPMVIEKVAPTLAEPLKPEPKEYDLTATFVRDTVADGTIMSPNHVFEQSWVLRNDGPVAWPAGCSVKYVGGDYMGHVDSNHPAEISKLVSASESIVCYDTLAPGQEFAFTVLLRTPSRPGKFVSYWRLSTPEGLKFGHRLWCDVSVRSIKVEEPAPAPEVPIKTEAAETPVVEEADESSLASSRMIFPKLEKESPAASMHEQTRAPSTIAPSTIADDKVSSTGVPDESAEDEDWDVSEDGFLTDEEYDILDASDEELLEEQARKVQK